MIQGSLIPLSIYNKCLPVISDHCALLQKKLSTLKYARARFYAEASMGGDFGAKILAGILRVTSYEELRSHTEKLLKVFRSFLHVFSF